MEENDFARARRGRRQAARRGRPRRRQGRPDRAQDGRLGAQIRHQQHHPHRRPLDPRLRPDRQGHRAGGRHRRDRPYQRRPHRAARRSDPLPLRGLQARPRTRPQRQRARRAVTLCARRRNWASSSASSSAPTRRPAPACSRSASCAWSRCCPRSAKSPPEIAFCFATGNTARMRALDCGLIEVGRAADFVFLDRAQHSAGKTLLDSVAARRPPRRRHDRHRRHRALAAQPQHAAGRQGAGDCGEVTNRTGSGRHCVAWLATAAAMRPLKSTCATAP